MITILQYINLCFCSKSSYYALSVTIPDFVRFSNLLNPNWIMPFSDKWLMSSGCLRLHATNIMLWMHIQTSLIRGSVLIAYQNPSNQPYSAPHTTIQKVCSLD